MGRSPTVAPAGRSRRTRILRGLLIAAIVVVAAGFALSHSPIGRLMFEAPAAPFDPRLAPPAPDYADPRAWLAWPGRGGLERSTPAGVTPVDEAKAPADVFFIHPTTIRGSKVWNAAFDADFKTAPLNPPVLLEQVAAFNGCCRLYAPHYRQGTLAALRKSQPAFDLAYGDVRRAFRYYIAHENKGRPFIIASHSQGTGHADRLLQEEIIGTPLQGRMVAAYLIGGYVPADFAKIGLPICDAPRQTGCVLSYNTAQVGRRGARMVIDAKPYWWQGALKTRDPAPAVCVNPLNWRQAGAVPAAANPGSVPFPQPPFGTTPVTLPLVAQLTGAVCHETMLDVDISRSAPAGFRDTLTFLFGSYHLSDYGIFYAAIRGNAIERVDAWLNANPPKR